MSTPPDPSDESADDVTPRERVMGFWQHVDELRGTIIKSLGVFGAFAAAIGYYLVEFNRVLMWPFNHGAASFPELALKLATQTPMEGVNVIVQLCMIGGLMLAAPFILLFVAQFVAPALTQREMKAVLPMCGWALVLFLAGAAFAFFLLLPSTVRMMIEINLSFEWGFQWTVGGYYSLLTRFVLGMGAAFQFPLIIVLLTWLGFVSTAFLRKYRRHAIVLIFIVAAIATPTTEPLIQTLFAAPLYVLYEAAIIVARRIEKRRERSGGAVLLALLALLPRRRELAHA